jgi:hypothetical protein
VIHPAPPALAGEGLQPLVGARAGGMSERA